MEILFGESPVFHVNLGTRMCEGRWRYFNNDLKIKSCSFFFSHAERWCFINEPQNAQRRLIIFSCISAEKMKYNTPLPCPLPPPPPTTPIFHQWEGNNNQDGKHLSEASFMTHVTVYLRGIRWTGGDELPSAHWPDSHHDLYRNISGLETRY